MSRRVPVARTLLLAWVWAVLGFLLLPVLVALLEPALIVAMGAIVLAIVLAILMPIVELNQLLGK